MPRIVTLLLAGTLAGLLGCSSSNPFDAPEEPDTGTPTDPDPDESGIPEALAGAVQSMSYDAESESLTLAVRSLATTPLTASYARRTDLDRPGYKAFAVQEDALDRLFVAMVAESRDGAVRAAAVSDGGQFNRVYQGGAYQRDGAFDPPEIGDGPGAGQVSYAGNYVGLVNGGGAGQLIPTAPGTPPVLTPGQAGQVTGNVFINANFSDNSVNGAIYDRLLVDANFGLDDIVLIPTAIDDNGEFAGDVEYRGILNQGIGSYGGIFGGEDSASVAGIVALTEFEDAFEDEIEHGIFVLRRCGLAGDAAICDQVAPD